MLIKHKIAAQTFFDLCPKMDVKSGVNGALELQESSVWLVRVNVPTSPPLPQM